MLFAKAILNGFRSCQHPYIKLDVNKHDLSKQTALTQVARHDGNTTESTCTQPKLNMTHAENGRNVFTAAGESNQSMRDDVAMIFESMRMADALSMRLITLLASLGADPNVVLVCHDLQLREGATILDYVLIYCSSEVIRHFIFTFHPMNCGITCSIPLDLHLKHPIQTSDGLQPRTIFQRIPVHYRGIWQWISSPPTPVNIITNINQQLNTQQLNNMHTFTMATHPHVGRSSAVYRVFRSSPMYDSHLLRLIWCFLYISEILPVTQEELEAMEHTRLEKQQQQTTQMQD